MQIEWHCRQCNETGSTKADIVDLLKQRKNKENMIALMQKFVKITHDKCNGDMGVKLCQ